jgi:very-short-patch-repair endonuclease
MTERSKPRYIVIGQPVDDEKAQLSRSMRRHMTPSEAILWRHLRSNRLGGLHFRRQQIVEGFIADFYCHRAALAIEADGPVHDVEHDENRDEVFAARGIAVLRFTNDQIKDDLDSVLTHILHIAQSRIRDLES